MAQIISLFGNQKEAQRAVEALESADIHENSMLIIEDWDEMVDSTSTVLPVPNVSPGMAGAPLAEVSSLEDLDVSDGAKMFLKRSVQEGGTLLVVELDDDDDIDQVKQILSEHDGRLAGD